MSAKSGRIVSDDIAGIVAKGEHIKDVLEKFSDGIETVQLYIVYDHFLNDVDKVEKMFVDSSIEPKRLDQVRELVRDWQ